MEEKFKEEIIDIKGMHCKSCTENIESKLSHLEGIDKARISLVEEKVYVRFDSTKTNIDNIRKEIETMGYKTYVSSDRFDKLADASINDDKPKKSTIKQGIIYGLIPHIGCIAFIVGSVLGVTVLTQFFRPLLLNPYFFDILIALSLGFATLSSILYLRRNGLLTTVGAKRKWKYLSTMYGSTVGINLLLFLVIFPLLANVSLASPTGNFIAGVNSSLSTLKLQVDIPCSGHATLISGDLKTVNGVLGIQFSLPNVFEVTYDSSKTSKQQILALDVFKTYKATALSESADQSNQLNVAGASTSNFVGSTDGGLAAVTNGVQVVQLSVQGSNYYPNPIRVKTGIPVQLVADINNMPGCSKSIVIPEFGVRKVVSTSDNVIEFTPDKSGTFNFSCSMNMFRGQIVVENVDGSVAAFTGSAPATVSSGSSCGSGSCGCGCGSR
jgi:copper chaperone CopZ